MELALGTGWAPGLSQLPRHSIIPLVALTGRRMSPWKRFRPAAGVDLKTKGYMKRTLIREMAQ